MISVYQCNDPGKLAYIPDWSQYNPYQKLLYEELEASGITSDGVSGADFTLAWIINNRKIYSFIHLHWLHGLYHWQSKWLCWCNVVVLLFKILLARLIGYKVIWTVHNFVSHDTLNYKTEMIARKIVARAVNHVIVHCEYARSQVIKLFGVSSKKVIAAPHGSYIGHYSNNISRSDARKILNIEDGRFAFLFFGMLRNYKGVKELLLSYCELKKTSGNISLIIAGKPHNEALKREIEGLAVGEGISLHLRYIADDEVQIFFNACDVVVLPYLNILTSGAAVLALSFGRPVIAPAKGCIPELMDESVAFLYRNQNELSGAMAEATIKTDISEMFISAIKRAEELSWGKIVADYYLPILQSR